MTIMDKFKTTMAPEDNEPNSQKRVKGRITLINEEGWGFITSREIPFRRIFFHWSWLEQETLKFEELEEGMLVEFKALNLPEKGWRAIKIIITDKREDRNAS